MSAPQKVGYKRPPVYTRFRPGQSGNPSGRPKRQPGFRSALLAELAEAMPAADRERGGSKLQALVKTIVDSAIAGNARAQAILVSVLTHHGSDEIDAETERLTPDDRAILEDYVGDEIKRRTALTNPTETNAKLGDDQDAGSSPDDAH